MRCPPAQANDRICRNRMTAMHALETVTLSNGLTVALMPDLTAEMFSFCLSVPAGARTDPPDQSGLAHYLEHCYALGSSTLAPRQIDLIVERAGGVRGAVTTQDVTLHFCTMVRAALVATLRIEADRFAALALPAAEVADDQRSSRSAGGALVHRLLAAAFECHPYRNPVVGWPHEVRRLTRDNLRACYRAHYVPANATIALTAGFDAAAALDLIEHYFGGADSRLRPVVEPAPEPEQTAPRWESMVHPNASRPRLAVLWKVPPLDHPDTASLVVLEAALRQAEPAPRVSHWLLRDQSPFTLDIEGADLSEVEARAEWTSALIADFAGGGLRDELLVASGRAAVAEICGLLSRPADAAQTLARFQATSRTGVARLLELSDRLTAVTPAEVARAAARYLHPEKATTVRMMPA
jgi:zinc protease